MPPKLPTAVYSVDQVLAGAEELHQYSRRLEQLARGRKAEAMELSGEAVALLAILPEAQRNQSIAIEELREKLEQVAATSATVTLVMAAPPPVALKQELTDWLRVNVHSQVLVNFHVDPEIGGGIVIRGTSRIFDCSFRSALLANQAKFTQVLDRV